MKVMPSFLSISYLTSTRKLAPYYLIDGAKVGIKKQQLCSIISYYIVVENIGWNGSPIYYYRKLRNALRLQYNNYLCHNTPNPNLRHLPEYILPYLS